MSRVSRLPNFEERIDQASLWIARMDAGLSDEQQDQLGEWLAEDKENRELLFNLAEQWDKMDGLSRLSEIVPHTLEKNRHGKSRFRFEASLQWASAIAACFMVVIFSGWFWQNAAIETPAIDTATAYETAVGEQSSIFLPDGSLMRLNTNTLVRVNYTAEQRLLSLVRGELNVEVAHNPDRPLSVIANDKVVRAVGTQFNVEITSDQELELVVTEGQVLVTVLSMDTDSDIEVINPSLPMLAATDVPPLSVSAGEEVVFGGEVAEPQKILPEEIKVKLSWHQGNLTFRGESLEEAMSEVGRYTSIEFVFLDEQAKQVRIAGLFKAGDLNTLLSTLEENFNITYKRVGPEKIELSSL